MIFCRRKLLANVTGANRKNLQILPRDQLHRLSFFLVELLFFAPLQDPL